MFLPEISVTSHTLWESLRGTHFEVRPTLISAHLLQRDELSVVHRGTHKDTYISMEGTCEDPWRCLPQHPTTTPSYMQLAPIKSHQFLHTPGQSNKIDSQSHIAMSQCWALTKVAWLRTSYAKSHVSSSLN